MKYVFLLFLVGCSVEPSVKYAQCGVGGYCVAWDNDGNGLSYKTFKGEDKNGFKNTCLPCSEAKSKEARFVCFGEKP